ncbi:MAG: Signal peptidase I T [Actinobacteria bacterium ADurb.Bin346]|nr:MAG: Signal peptidase I T [Actinobacteria bacterium ADurb.Bin346]
MNSKNKKNVFKELLGYLIVAVIAAMISIGLRIFVIEPFIVPTPSMSPTLLVGDKVIVNKLEYKYREIKRGDIVAIYSPLEKKNLVKRVIGLQNEVISFDKEGEVFIDGKKIEETYLPKDFVVSYENRSYEIGEDEYFVMGDNRNNSADSRVFGPIRSDKIFGKVIFIYGPLSRIGKPG